MSPAWLAPAPLMAAAIRFDVMLPGATNANTSCVTWNRSVRRLQLWTKGQADVYTLPMAPMGFISVSPDDDGEEEKLGHFGCRKGGWLRRSYLTCAPQYMRAGTIKERRRWAGVRTSQFEIHTCLKRRASPAKAAGRRTSKAQKCSSLLHDSRTKFDKNTGAYPWKCTGQLHTKT